MCVTGPDHLDRDQDAGRARGDDPRPLVAVYREMLLNFNEPFVRHQAEALTRYRAHYVGDRRVAHGAVLPVERTHTLREHYEAADRALARMLPGPLARAALASRSASLLFRVLGRDRRLEARLRGLDVALVHAHTGLSGAQVLTLARRLDVPLVVTHHGYETTGGDASFRRTRRGRVFLRRRARMKRDVDRFIACSAFIERRMLEQGYPPERTVQLYTGIDVGVYAPAPSAARELVVLFAGRLVDGKGVHHLLDAMQAVAASVPGAQLVVAGAGRLVGDLQQRAGLLRVPATFLGAVPAEAVRDWMRRASVLAVPSVPAATGQVEALSGVAVEALAAGLPVVASRIGGIPEVVDDGVTGLLVPPADPAALARALVRVLTDGDLRSRLAAASRERALRDFDLARQTAKLEAIYDAVMASRSPRGRPFAAR